MKSVIKYYKKKYFAFIKKRFLGIPYLLFVKYYPGSDELFTRIIPPFVFLYEHDSIEEAQRSIDEYFKRI